jgi:hypothetical protein
MGLLGGVKGKKTGGVMMILGGIFAFVGAFEILSQFALAPLVAGGLVALRERSLSAEPIVIRGPS